MLSKNIIYTTVCSLFALLSLGAVALADTTVQPSGAMAASPSVGSEQNSFLKRFSFNASLSQGYLISNRNNWVAETEAGTFDFNEFAANLSFEVSDNLRVGFQLMSRDFGPLMDNKVFLDWALIDYRWRDFLGVRLGRLKTPFGLYNANRDVDIARIAILLPTGIYPERGRDTVESINGGALYGTLELGGVGTVEYFAGYGEKFFDEDGGTAHYLQDHESIMDSGSISKNEMEQAIQLQLSYDTPVDGLRLVGSYALGMDFLLEGRSSIGGVPGGPSSIDVPDAYTWVGSVEYSLENFVFAAEYRYLLVRDQTFSFEHAVAGTVSTVTSTPSSGWYVSGSYRFSDFFATELYYTELYPDDDDRDGSRFVALGQDDFLAWQKDLCLTGRFDLTENWIIKAAVTFSNGLGGGFPADYPLAGVASEEWILYQLKTTFVF